MLGRRVISRDKFYYDRILTGERLIPDHLMIGNDCHRGHGIDGRAVRIKKSSLCCQCRALAVQKYDKKNYFGDWDKRRRIKEPSKKIDIDHKRAELEDQKLNSEIYDL